jgi:serine/threonine protein kinase
MYVIGLFELTIVYLITDLCLGGELFDRICRKGNYYESDAANLVRTTVSAVSYLHDHGIVHRGMTHVSRVY